MWTKVLTNGVRREVIGRLMGLLTRLFAKHCNTCGTILQIRPKRFDFEPDEYYCQLCDLRQKYKAVMRKKSETKKD